MKKLLVALLAVTLGLSMTMLAQDDKKGQADRLSGKVKTVDAKTMTIEITMSRTPSAVRKVMWDASTKVQVGDKEGTSADIKEGMRIVAVGKFEGVNLKATRIRVRNQ
jgi:hypothetical protein